MRVLLFTDTLGDVNGVARFIRDAAAHALATHRELTVFTSTRFEVPATSNIRSFAPLAAMQMPGYSNLEIALPPAVAMLRAAAAFRPDVVHVSTPGPVGTVGRLFARIWGLPLVGVYHTDFPAYVDRLIQRESLVQATTGTMSWFYSAFNRVFTRSHEYAKALRELGVRDNQIEWLKPGIDLSKFSDAPRDFKAMQEIDGKPNAYRVLFVGRVSVEKGLPRLAAIWPEVHRELNARNIPNSLVVVGDGPYRSQMATQLAGNEAYFPGFRHGKELATLYTSCDVFAFPSTTDTLGQVVLEAQAAGLPVISTDEGGPREVIDNGRTGLVLSANDSNAWCNALVELGTDVSRRQAMSAAARNWSRAYDFGGSFDHFWSVHERVALEASIKR